MIVRSPGFRTHGRPSTAKARRPPFQHRQFEAFIAMPIEAPVLRVRGVPKANGLDARQRMAVGAYVPDNARGPAPPVAFPQASRPAPPARMCRPHRFHRVPYSWEAHPSCQGAQTCKILHCENLQDTPLSRRYLNGLQVSIKHDSQEEHEHAKTPLYRRHVGHVVCHDVPPGCPIERIHGRGCGSGPEVQPDPDQRHSPRRRSHRLGVPLRRSAVQTLRLRNSCRPMGCRSCETRLTTTSTITD